MGMGEHRPLRNKQKGKDLYEPVKAIGGKLKNAGGI